MDFLEGRFVRLIFQSEDGAFGIGLLEDDDGEEHKIKGAIMATPGDRVRVSGEWVRHPRYGRQFKIKDLRLGEPSKDRDGICGYLERLPNIGAVRAATIYREFGEKTFEVIENEPERLAEAPGITARMVEGIHAAFMGEREQRELIVFLKRFELTDNKIAKIMGCYGRGLKRVLKEEPYRMINDIHGFGWKIVDEIALAAGVAKDSPGRIRAGIRWVLGAAEDDGNTYLPRDTLFSQACKALQVPAVRVVEELANMIEAERLDEKLVDSGGNIYLPGLFASEVRAARALARVAGGKKEEGSKESVSPQPSPYQSEGVETAETEVAA